MIAKDLMAYLPSNPSRSWSGPVAASPPSAAALVLWGPAAAQAWRQASGQAGLAAEGRRQAASLAVVVGSRAAKAAEGGWQARRPTWPAA